MQVIIGNSLINHRMIKFMLSLTYQPYMQVVVGNSLLNHRKSS